MEEAYLALLDTILEKGKRKNDRTNTGVYTVFGPQLEFSLRDGVIPIFTTKKIHLRSVIHELLWFLNGDTNIKYLVDNGVSIWNEWADENGDLGPVYGKQWRSWQKADGTTVDQIANLIETLKKNPDSRRMLVVAYNPGEVDKMKLPPCHCLFQFYVEDNRLSCKMYQRSSDMFLGVPFNVASYSMLVHMIAHQCGMEADRFIWTSGDTHIYINHLTQVEEQLGRTPYKSPTISFARKPDSIFDYKYEDFVIENYRSHLAISAPKAV